MWIMGRVTSCHVPCYLMGLLPDKLNCGLRMRRECRERFLRHRLQRKPLVSDPGMHHGTCVTHVPWCMSESPTYGGGENVPGILCACVTHNYAYLERGPLKSLKIVWILVLAGENCSTLDLRVRDSDLNSMIEYMCICFRAGRQVVFLVYGDDEKIAFNVFHNSLRLCHRLFWYIFLAYDIYIYIIMHTYINLKWLIAYQMYVCTGGWITISVSLLLEEISGLHFMCQKEW